MVVQDQAEMGEGSTNLTDPHHTPIIIQPSTSQPQKKQKPRKSKRKDNQITQSSGPTDNVADEAVNEEMHDSLKRATTTATILDAEQDMGNIAKTQSKATLNEPCSIGTSSGSGPRRQETMGDTIAQTGFENTTKTTQANEIASLKRRVKKLERKNKSRTHGLQRLYKVGLTTRTYLVNDQDDANMFDVNDLDGDEVIVDNVYVVKTVKETRNMVEEVTAAITVSTANTIPVSAATTTTTITEVEITLAQALAELKSAKPKADKLGTSTTTTTISSQPSQEKVQDKVKGIMVEEPVKMNKKDQMSFDEQEAKRLQAEFDEEERLAREKDEANLAQRLQAQEQEALTDEEKARLFVQFLEQRRKHFAAKRAEEKSNRPPTKTQQRKIMCTYLKNMEGKKPKDLKNKSFDSIQKMFDRAFKRVNTFVDYRTELVEESSKKAEKVEEDKVSKELKQCLEIVPDDVTIDATPLSIKSPTIVDYKIYQEGKKSFFQIIRADGKYQMYLTFSKMLKNFDREDLEVLWSIVKARFKKTEPVNYMDSLLFHHLKTMFEHHVEDNVWKNQQCLVKVLNWKLYDSCGVHYLQVDYECEMAYELLRLVKKQLKEGYVPE
ncbi:hypothetical protein Tco_0623321 [Tanacetum coccineum]